MTDLQLMYVELREQGLGHRAALRKLAHRLNVDAGTVQNTLRRAEHDYGPTWTEKAA